MMKWARDFFFLPSERDSESTSNLEVAPFVFLWDKLLFAALHWAVMLALTCLKQRNVPLDPDLLYYGMNQSRNH